MFAQLRSNLSSKPSFNSCPISCTAATLQVFDMISRLAFCVLSLCLTFPAFAAFQVIDDESNTVELDAPAQRIISLAPHITELLFAAGAGAQVVGTVAYSDHPAEALSVPRVGN